MNRWFSIYLDVIRLLAAAFVVYAHSNVRFLYPEKLPLAEYAHSAVTVFFVLSGFVVAFVVDNRENAPIRYIASRSSRILSLSILAVLATPLIDAVGRHATDQLYATTIPSDYIIVRAIASILFLAEVWTVSITTFSNIPYWSLNYEVWYYVLFGIYCFGNKNHRWILIAAILIILGPKIALMAPCWLSGVVAYRLYNKARHIKPMSAIFTWTISAVAFYYYHHFDLMRGFSEGVVLAFGGPWLHTQLNFSRYFAADWLLSLIISINFVASRKLCEIAPNLKANSLSWVNYVGSLTYALYIIHFPFIYMWGSIFDSHPPNGTKYALVITLVITCVALFATIGEWLRPRMRYLIESLLTSKLSASKKTSVRVSDHA